MLKGLRPNKPSNSNSKPSAEDSEEGTASASTSTMASASAPAPTKNSNSSSCKMPGRYNCVIHGISGTYFLVYLQVSDIWCNLISNVSSSFS